MSLSIDSECANPNAGIEMRLIYWVAFMFSTFGDMQFITSLMESFLSLHFRFAFLFPNFIRICEGEGIR